jgi:hypothetical protein
MVGRSGERPTRASNAVYHQVRITTGNMSLSVWETPLGLNEIRNDNNDPNSFDPARFNWDGSAESLDDSVPHD